MLSIIIPIKQSWIKPDCFIRLFLNLYHLKQLIDSRKVNVVIADSSRTFNKPLIRLIASIFKQKYVNIEQTGYSFYSPAFVKNSSAKYAFEYYNASYVFFLDVDVLINQKTLNSIDTKIEENCYFDWYPVDFLTKKHALKSMIRNAFVNQIDVITHDDVLQTGFVTGCHLINKKFFYDTKGYDEQFIGYGCEDIEYIHRATKILGLRPSFTATDNYYVDDRGYNLDELIGFRNFYYKLKKTVSNSEINPKHFWHERKNDSEYLKDRKSNDIYLLAKMKLFDQE